MHYNKNLLIIMGQIYNKNTIQNLGRGVAIFVHFYRIN